ncbi:YadA-like family protein [Xanthomonas translucens]|nr:YadA-like family protein [Xanthomonas translucens pv. translucens]MCT8271355.1 YadA-like family protein [Xanthomonas translucens pv. undulosa]UII62443.1 YadA-like family protein [Xanthomonas translucens]MCS3371949.1 YadA-like family protein [Xanthomonas translucens pv. translucens]MCT8273723.1 YadA-like family protein [Xanthomonas translucens pv. translucens]
MGANAKVNADGSTAVGANARIAAVATNAVALGEGASVSTASGTALGQGASVTASNAVALGQGSVADRANTVSVGSGGNERQIANVAAGSAGTDAANVAQMRSGDSATLSSANAYTNTRVTALDDSFNQLRTDTEHRLDGMDRRMDRLGAMSAAMLNMAINAAGTQSARGRVSLGAGFQGGEQALSIGYAKKLGTRASFSLGGSFSGSDSSAGIGVGVDL